MFLGIDHTAIAVDDTNVSLRFYRDTLGMQVAGESENYDVGDPNSAAAIGEERWYRIAAKTAADTMNVPIAPASIRYSCQ